MALYLSNLPRWIAACFIGWACVCFFAWCLANAAKRRDECLPRTPTDYEAIIWLLILTASSRGNCRAKS